MPIANEIDNNTTTGSQNLCPTGLIRHLFLQSVILAFLYKIIPLHNLKPLCHAGYCKYQSVRKYTTKLLRGLNPCGPIITNPGLYLKG